MSKKRNDNNPKVPTEGYIVKYFKDDIECLLTPVDWATPSTEPPYVPHVRAECFLENYKRAAVKRDRAVFFTGLTGSGKSTILRNFLHFGIWERVTHVIDRENRTLLIPITFNDTFDTPAETTVLSGLREALFAIASEFHIAFPSPKNAAFCRYVEKNHTRIRFTDKKYYEKTTEEVLASVEESENLRLECIRLQYLMEQIEELDHILLLIDDVEGYSSDDAKALEPVVCASRIFETLTRDEGNIDRNWWLSIIISCRHHIYRMAKDRQFFDSDGATLVESFAETGKYFDLFDPVEIEPIVVRRGEVFSNGRDKTQWETALRVVKDILFQAGDDIGEFVHQLELKDTRKTFESLRNIVLNKNLQKEEEIDAEPGSFRIDSTNQFDISHINLIRQYGLGGYKYYADDLSKIPNLLHNFSNTAENPIELYPLLTLTYFLRKFDYHEPSWTKSYEISDFHDAVMAIFSSKSEAWYDKTFGESVRFLIKSRLLLRSADQDQNQLNALQFDDELRRVEKVYSSGAAICMWNELGKSSALFQLFIDDIFLPDDSDYFGPDGNDVEHCVEYLEFLWDREQCIYNDANKSKYCEHFGTRPVCFQLLDGLERSLNNIYYFHGTGNAKKRSAETALRRLEALKLNMRY